MHITGIETFLVGNPWKNWVFVKVRTNEDLYGVGEGSLLSFAKTVESAIHELEPLVVGLDPMRIESMCQRLTRDVYTDGGQIHMSAVAAIEMACWDIVGKVVNQPIYNLWGGRCHERLRAYANGWYRGPRTPESFAETAKAVLDRGYTALKLDPFGSAWRTLTPYELGYAMDIVRAVRSVVGPETDVLIEGHSRFSASTALEVARALEPFRPTWFEEPVPHQNIAAMVEVARRSPVSIATGESFTSKQQFAELLKHDVVSIFQPEPLNMGGLFATKKVADMVDAHYGVVAPHSAQGPVCSAACVQVNASLPNFFLQEFFDDFNEPWEAAIIDFPVRVTDGYMEISSRPGLGIDLNLDEMARHPYRQGNYLPLFKPGWEERRTQDVDMPAVTR